MCVVDDDVEFQHHKKFCHNHFYLTSKFPKEISGHGALLQIRIAWNFKINNASFKSHETQGGSYAL